MTRPHSDGLPTLNAVPACSLAESFTTDERVLLGELGVEIAPPALRLVPASAAAPAAATETIPLRQPLLGLLAIVVTAAAIAAAALTSMLGQLDALTP